MATQKCSTDDPILQAVDELITEYETACYLPMLCRSVELPEAAVVPLIDAYERAGVLRWRHSIHGRTDIERVAK